MAATKAYIAGLIFTGNEWLNDYAVIVEDGLIKTVLPAKDVPSVIEKEYFTDSILAPAFIDLQIYGAYEKLFAVYPDTNSLKLLNDYSKSGGAAFCMPTVATNQPEVLFKCIV